VGLSRGRFYELMRVGIFPKPSRHAKTKRPYFSREQQEQCYQVRRTHQGINGQAVLFYLRQPQISSKPKAKRPPASIKRPRPKNASLRDPLIDELRHGLEQLGLAGFTDANIRSALADAHPDGHRNVEMTSLLMTVFHALKRQNSNDNVA